MKRLIISIKSVCLVFIASFCCLVVQTSADTIVLKNGNKTEVDHAWEEDGLIKGKKPYGFVSFPKDTVQTVIYEKETPNDSFEFDIWQAGISIEKAFKIADKNDIPLARIGSPSLFNKFNQNIYKDINKFNAFHYQTKLMDRYADVSLCFTPTSRVLHKVIVSLTAAGAGNKGFKEEILNMLKSKYGNKIKYSKQLFGDTRIWNANRQYTVSMIYQAGYIKIEYSDNALGNQNGAEKKKIEDKKRKEYTEKDSPKF